MGIDRAVHAVLTSVVLCSEKRALEVTGGQEGSSGCVVSRETNCLSPPGPPISQWPNQVSRASEFGSVFQGPLVISRALKLGMLDEAFSGASIAQAQCQPPGLCAGGPCPLPPPLPPGPCLLHLSSPRSESLAVGREGAASEGGGVSTWRVQQVL